MLDSVTLSRWVGHAVHDPSNQRIGDLIQVYVDSSDTPQWLVIKRGTMTVREDLVPASVASVGPAGLTVSLDASTIHGSPRVRDRHHLTAAEEQSLSDYYTGAIAGAPAQ